MIIKIGFYLLSLLHEYKRRFGRVRDFENFCFLLLLPGPLSIFVEYRIRFGIIKLEILFRFASPFTFRYICKDGNILT